MGTEFEHGYALLIGVGGDLPESIHDATDLAEVLLDPARAAYSADHVLLRPAEKATRAGVLAAFDELAKLVANDPEATVILYYSGHGAEVPEGSGKYYLLTSGHDLAKPDETCVKDAELSAAIAAIHAKKLLVLLDCCHAAGMPKGKGGPIAKAALPVETLEALKKGTGSVVLASCRTDQRSYVDPFSRNSRFTEALLEALAVGGQGGEARIFQVIDHVTLKLSKRAPPQEPLVVKAENLSSFTICRSGWVPKGTGAGSGGAKSAGDSKKPKISASDAAALRAQIAAYEPGVLAKAEQVKTMRDAIDDAIDAQHKAIYQRRIERAEQQIAEDRAKIAAWREELGED